MHPVSHVVVINLKVLKSMLSRLGVQHIQIFTDGAKAIASLRKTKNASLLPTLIFSDLDMPSMSGFDFLNQVKESTLYEKSPVVIACSGTLFCIWFCPIEYARSLCILVLQRTGHLKRNSDVSTMALMASLENPSSCLPYVTFLPHTLL